MALAGGTPDSVESLLDLYLRSVGLGSNLILNFPPTTTGQIAPSFVEVAEGFGAAVSALYSNPIVAVHNVSGTPVVLSTDSNASATTVSACSHCQSCSFLNHLISDRCRLCCAKTFRKGSALPVSSSRCGITSMGRCVGIRWPRAVPSATSASYSHHTHTSTTSSVAGRRSGLWRPRRRRGRTRPG